MGVHDEFGGVIGRDWRDVDAVVAAASRSRRPARPTSCCIVLDDVGFAQLGCYGSDIATPTIDRLAAGGRAARQLPHHRAVLADPRRACSPAATTTRNGMGRVADLAVGLPGLQRAHPARERLPLRDPARARLRDVRGRQVAPHARRRDAHGRRRSDAGRSGAGFERCYGFLGGETHQFVPDALPRQPLGAAAAARSTRATTSPRTWPTTRSSTSRDLRSVDADQPFFLYLATGACHSPHHAPPEWIERYRGQFDDGWDAWRERDASPASSELGIAPAGHRAVAAPAVGAGVGRRSSPTTRAVAARFMECFAGVPLAHRRPDRPRARRSSSEPGELDNTLIVLVSDNGASAEGGAHGSINDARLWNGDPGRPHASCATRIDELGGPTAAQQLPVGLDDGRQHAVPALEARGARGRRRRSVHRALAARASRATAARSATSSCTRSTCCPTILELIGIDAPDEIGGVAQSADRRHELRATLLDDADARRAPHARSTSRCSARRGIYHDGWKAVTFKPLGADVRRRPRPRRAVRRRRVGALPRRRATSSEMRRPRRRASPSGSPSMVDLWWEEARALPRAPARQPPARRDPEPATAPDRSSASRYVLPAVRRAGARERRGQRAATARTRSPPTSTIADGVVAEGVLLAIGLRARRLVASPARRPAALRAQPLRQGAVDVIESDVVIGAGRAHARVPFTRDRRRTAAPAELLVDGEVVGAGDDPAASRRSRYTNTGAGLSCGYELGPSVGDGYDAPFRCNGDAAPRASSTSRASRASIRSRSSSAS